MKKNVQYHQSLGKCKLKPWWGTTTHLLEWPKLKWLSIPSVGEEMEKLELSKSAGENINGTTILENSLTVSFKLNIHVPYDQSIPLLGVYPKDQEIYVHT